MNESITIVLSLLAGIMLGAFFFGGLWLTVQKGLTSKNPSVWFFFSMLLRILITLTGFYFVSNGDFYRLISCLGGFIISKIVFTRLTKRLEKHTLTSVKPKQS